MPRGRLIFSSDDESDADFDPPDPPPLVLPRQQGNWKFFGFDRAPAWWFYASAENARAQASNLAQGLPPAVPPQHEDDAAAAANAAADDAPDLNAQQDAPQGNDQPDSPCNDSPWWADYWTRRQRLAAFDAHADTPPPHCSKIIAPWTTTTGPPAAKRFPRSSRRAARLPRPRHRRRPLEHLLPRQQNMQRWFLHHPGHPQARAQAPPPCATSAPKSAPTSTR